MEGKSRRVRTTKDSATMKSSRIVSSSALQEFNFYADGTIWRGAATPEGLYKLIGEYSAANRTHAFLLSMELERSGFYSIVSVELDGMRRVWAEIRSLISPIPIMRIETLVSVDG